MRPDTAIYTAFDEHRPVDLSEPEKLLMLAILRTALEDLKKRGEPHRDARRYFLSADDHYLYSFQSICQHLNFCPKTILATAGLNGEAAQQASSAKPIVDDRLAA